MAEYLEDPCESKLSEAYDVLQQVEDFDEGEITLVNTATGKTQTILVRRDNKTIIFVLPDGSECFYASGFKTWFDQNKFDALRIASKDLKIQESETDLEPLSELLEIIRRKRKNLTTCLAARLKSVTVEELPRLVLAQALSCLRTKKLNQVQLLQILESAGYLTVIACELAEFENSDLIDDIRKQCSKFEIDRLKTFFKDHNKEITKESTKQKIIKAIFYGSWAHLAAWSVNEESYHQLFPKLNHLLEVATKSDGNHRIKVLKANRKLIRELDLTGSDIGQLCRYGDLEAKLKALESNQELIRELDLTGYAIGQLCLTGDLEAKLKALEANRDLIRELDLTGSAIGQLCLAGDLEVKLKVLKANRKLIRELDLTGSAIGQLCLAGDLEAKLKVLESNRDLIRELGLTSSAIGQLCLAGDLEVKLKVLESNQDLIRELDLTGSAIGQLCLVGDLEVKLKVLKANQDLIRELDLTGYAIGQLCLTGDLEAKLKALKANQDLIRELDLTGSAIGQLCFAGDLEAKLKVLESNRELIRELGLTSYAIGQLCLNGDLEAKLKVLESNRELIRELGLTSYAIGQLCFAGDLEAKLKVLKANQELIRELDLTGYAIGQLCLVGDLEAKLKVLEANQDLIGALKLSGYRLGLFFDSAQEKVIQENLQMISKLKQALDKNASFDAEANSTVFPQIFTKALAGYVVTQKWRLGSKEFRELEAFFGSADFRELFIQTSGKTTKKLKAYIETLTGNPNFQYLLLTYLTGNRSIGQKQWAMLKKVISGTGREFFPFVPMATGRDGKPLPDDRKAGFADNIDLEESVIKNLDTSIILKSFFNTCRMALTEDEIQSMKSFIRGLDRDLDISFLETLLTVFGNAEMLKQFLLGEMEASQIEALSENLQLTK